MQRCGVRHFVLLPAAAFLLGGCATQRSAPAPAVTPIPELASFAPLVGGTWRAEFSAKLHDEQHYEWLYGGKFLRNEHWVKNEQGATVYEGQTIYAFDPDSQRVMWWYWNATGGYIEGTARWQGSHAEFEGVNHAPGTQTPRVRSTLDLGEGEWTSTGWFEKDGAWAEQGRRTYRRVR